MEETAIELCSRIDHKEKSVTMNNLPLVSVIMTAYYREKYIAEAIESVLASTYINFELIIVDDGSKDNTAKIAKEFEEKDNRIKVYVNEKNLGDYPNRNKASSFAKGEFIMYVDSDDKILPDGIINCVKAMKDYPEASFGMHCPEKHVGPFILDSKNAIHDTFFKKYFLDIGPGGTIIKRAFFEKINKYPTKYGPANDMYFNLKAVCYSPVVLLPFEFMFYRIHDAQEFNNSYSYMINNYRYLSDIIQELPLPLTQQQKDWLVRKGKRRFAVNIFKYFFKTLDFRKTKNAINEADFSLADAFAGIFH